MRPFITRHPKIFMGLTFGFASLVNVLTSPYPALRFYIMMAAIAVFLGVVGFFGHLLWSLRSIKNRPRPFAPRPRFEDERPSRPAIRWEPDER